MDLIANVSTLEDLDILDERLRERDHVLRQKLDLLLQEDHELSIRMNALRMSLPKIGLVEDDAKHLKNVLEKTDGLAEKVSSKVRVLDKSMSKIKGAMERADDMLDLKLCTEGLQEAMAKGNYEHAAAHVHKFLSMDEEVLATICLQGEEHQSSLAILKQADESLKVIVREEFDKAVTRRDSASIDRYFKLFPLLNKQHEGLRCFSDYLGSLLSDRSSENLQLATAGPASSTGLYAGLLAILFEDVAQIIERQQPYVESYYGLGKMFPIIASIQQTIDDQAKVIIDAFDRDKQWSSKVKRVLSSSSKEDCPDPKQIDPLLSEVALLNARADLYLRFIKKRVLADLENVSESERDAMPVTQLSDDSAITRRMQTLISDYIPMEEFFMRESFLKAVSLNVVEEGCLTSSMVDDTFFIISKSLRRSLSTGSVDAFCAMLNHAVVLVEDKLVQVLMNALKAGFPSGILDQAFAVFSSSLQQGGKLDSDSVERAKSAFLVAMNNAHLTADNVVTLKSSLESELASMKVSAQHEAKLDSCLSQLTKDKVNKVLEYGIGQLTVSALKPRLKPWVDTFLEEDHQLSEDTFAELEVSDPWLERLISNLDTMLTTFEGCLVTEVYDQLVTAMTSLLVVQFEKGIFKVKFNRLGGLILDRRLRSITGYLTAATGWSVRDRFTRLNQISTLLNLERVSEVSDYWSGTWRVGKQELKAVLKLRSDFRREDINSFSM